MKSFRIRPSRVLTLAVTLGALLAADLAIAPPKAEAQTAARVESRTRPNFGLLLDPPTRPHRRRPRYAYDDYRPGRDRPGWGNGGPGWGYDQDEIVVDCGGPDGQALEYAIQALRPGGALTLRGQGGVCVGWLYIDKPITLQGEGGFDPRTGARVPAAVLQAPDGRPCLTVASGVQVTIQDLTLLSPNGGSAACVTGENADIVMRRVALRHEGMEPAIDLRGGLLDLRDAQIDARTGGAAVVAENATLNTQNLIISGSVAGIELEQGARAPSIIHSTTLTGMGAPNSFGPRAIGVAVRARQDSARVEISNSRICGFAEGVAVEGVAVHVRGVRICRTDKGLVLYNGELSLHESRIRAREVGWPRSRVGPSLQAISSPGLIASSGTSPAPVWKPATTGSGRGPRPAARVSAPATAIVMCRSGRATTVAASPASIPPIPTPGGPRRRVRWVRPITMTATRWMAGPRSSPAMAGMIGTAAMCRIASTGATTAGPIGPVAVARMTVVRRAGGGRRRRES